MKYELNNEIRTWKKIQKYIPGERRPDITTVRKLPVENSQISIDNNVLNVTLSDPFKLA